MKVCVITSLYLPYHRGGAEVIAEKDVRRIKDRGDEVFVITIKPWSGWASLKPRLENVGGVRVYRFYPLNIFSFVNINKWPFLFRLKWHLFDTFNFHSYFAVKKILKREKPDLVLTHNLKGIGYLTWRAIKSLGIKNIHTLHDVQLAVPSGLLVYGREKRYWLYEKVCRWLIGSSAEVISPSQWLLDFYSNKGFFPKSKKTVDSAFGALPPVKKLDLKPSNRPVSLLYVGQIEEHKGITWLVETLKKLEIGNWKLEIIGDGSKFEEVKRLVVGDERFKVLGRLEGGRLVERLKASDFVVVPSLCYENSPMIIAESLKLDVPVIASKIGGIVELIKEGENGRFFQPGSAADFGRVFEDIFS